MAEAKGDLKPNCNIPKIEAKRVISEGLIYINYNFTIPADHSNYTVLLIYFSLFEDYIHEKGRGEKKTVFIINAPLFKINISAFLKQYIRSSEPSPVCYISNLGWDSSFARKE